MTKTARALKATDHIIDADGFAHVIAEIQRIPATDIEPDAVWIKCFDGDRFAYYGSETVKVA